ncbi:MAG: phosphate ABC transporter permease subunit PstC [Bacteroidota bacterium]
MIESREEVPPNPVSVPNIQKRKRRWGETFAETTIKVVASFSILLIALIFIFVFKEASSLFFKSDEEQKTEERAAEQKANPPAEDDLKPEVYNPETDLLLEENQGKAEVESSDAPESYGEDITESASGDTAAQAPVLKEENPDAMESYNPDVEDIPTQTPAETTETAPVEVAPKTIWHNLLGKVWQPVSTIPKFGLIPLLVGTLKATFVAIIIGAPLGILAAIYVALFAKRWVREIVKPAIELLASFPSVVIGFFCLMTLASIAQSLFGSDYRLNALVGGLGLAIAIIPIIFTLTEDALSAVPPTLREASLALGATEWETAFKVVLPAATPGVFAAVLLGIGRAFGETMIALMATGNAALSTWNVLDPVRTFAATIGAEMGEVIWGSEHYSILFFLGVLLFVFTFIMNAITELYVKQRLIKRFQGS